ncbi:MAG: HEAT repeat domain-containing protein [Desulfobacterales bacterium]
MSKGIYEKLAAGISAVCLIGSFFLKDAGIMVQILSAAAVVNFFVLLFTLFRRQVISSFTLVIFFFQAALLCRMFFLLGLVPGEIHYRYATAPRWQDWLSYAGIHVLKALDIADIIELYHIPFAEKIVPQSLWARVSLFGLNLSAALFAMGFLFCLFNSPAFLTFPAGTAKKYAIRGMIILVVSLSGYAWSHHWDTGKWAMCLWNNILSTLDIGDAMPLFGWSFFPWESRGWLSGLSLAFRILFALSLTGLSNRHILRILASGEFIRKMSAIALSGEYDTDKRVAAVQKLAQRRAVAESAMPGLVKLISDSSYQVRNAAASALDKIDPQWVSGPYGRKAVPDLIRMLKNTDREIQVSAARMLGRMGENAENAVPDILKLLEDPDGGMRRIGSDTLLQIGVPAIPRLIRRLENASEDLSRILLEILEQINPLWKKEEKAQNEIRRYIRMMTEEDGSARNAAVRILGLISPEPEEIIPQLIQALSDNNMRRSAIGLLGKMGADARSAMPRLLDALAENDSSVTEPVMNALDSIDHQWRRTEEARDAAQNFIRALEMGDQAAYEKPDEALKKIGFSAIPLLAETLASMNRNLQSKAAKILKSIHPEKALSQIEAGVESKAAKILKSIHPQWPKTAEAADAVPALTAALSHENWYVRSSAAKVLAMIGPPAKQAVPHLVKGMADTNKTIRATFKAALDRIMLKDQVFEDEDKEKSGSPAIQSKREEVVRFVNALRDSDPKTREHAALALGKLEPPAEEAIAHLLEILADGDRAVRQSAVMALGTIEPLWRDREEVAGVIPDFLQALAGEPSSYQHPSDALNAIGRGAIRHLIPLLTESNKVIANAASQLLEQIDPRWAASGEAPQAVDTLAEKLLAEQWFVRCAAAEILGNIGPAAKKAVPHLVRGLSDKNKQVRAAFKEAMDKILLKKQ